MNLRAALTLLRAGDFRTRMAAIRAGQQATKVARIAAAVDTGLLDALADGARSVEQLAEATGAEDLPLLRALLQVLGIEGLLKLDDDTATLTPRGERLVADPVARAAYSAFADFHTGLYRDLPGQLRGGSGRDDVARRAEAIADLSRMMQPFVESLLRREARSRGVRRVLDVGCGSGLLLATILEACPEAQGTGVELDPAAAELARTNLARAGLDARATVVTGDVRGDVLDQGAAYDLVLLANVIYYVPLHERVALLRSLRHALAPEGALIVVTTALIDNLFSRHFDLLLRAQQGAMELPDMEVLAGQLEDAGFRPRSPVRVAPGEPLMALIASPTSAE